MTAAATPGPWEYSASGDDTHAVVSPPVDAAHDFGPWFTAIVSCSDGEVETANARLIAAAPEMLAILQEADRRIIWENHGLGNGFAERVEEAITKATQS